MEWKKRLRVAMRNAGHKPTAIERTSARIKYLPLDSSENEYRASCSRCSLEVKISTTPGGPTAYESNKKPSSMLDENKIGIQVPKCSAHGA